MFVLKLFYGFVFFAEYIFLLSAQMLNFEISKAITPRQWHTRPGLGTQILFSVCNVRIILKLCIVVVICIRLATLE